VCVETLP
jgi:hypothetical protein